VGLLALLAVAFTTVAEGLSEPRAAPAPLIVFTPTAELGDDEEQTIALTGPADLHSTEASEAITRLVLLRIGLDTRVVPAPYAEGDGTWQIPSFIAGHAELTAEADLIPAVELSAQGVQVCSDGLPC
jgi:hypothetical protein